MNDYYEPDNAPLGYTGNAVPGGPGSGRKRVIPPRSPFGSYLEGRMEQRGVDSKELCRRTGMSDSHPSLLFCGYYHPSPLTARKIASALDITFEEIWSQVEASRRVWKGRRKNIRRPGGVARVPIATRTTEENEAWLERLCQARNCSLSQAISDIITATRIAERGER